MDALPRGRWSLRDCPVLLLQGPVEVACGDANDDPVVRYPDANSARKSKDFPPFRRSKPILVTASRRLCKRFRCSHGGASKGRECRTEISPYRVARIGGRWRSGGRGARRMATTVERPRLAFRSRRTPASGVGLSDDRLNPVFDPSPLEIDFDESVSSPCLPDWELDSGRGRRRWPRKLEQ